MNYADLKWGRMPDKFVLNHREEEMHLITEWREWNSDLLIGKHLVFTLKNKESISLGERIIIKCELAMSKIVKRLEEIRK